ncbi:MAG: ABC transporter substrate-binding protein [Bacteroidales bacterium]
MILQRFGKTLFIICLLLMASTSCKKESSEPVPVKFGAVLPLSGPDSDEGIMAKKAIEIALEELNSFMTVIGSETRYSCEILDMKSDSAECLEMVKQLKYKGIDLLLGGPYNSSELSGVKDYLDSQHMLMLNAYSTSPALSLEGDNIFRLLPDDNRHSKGTVALLNSMDIRIIFPLFVSDQYGIGFSNNIIGGFQQSGGQVSQALSFTPGTLDFSDMMNTLNDRVSAVIPQFGAEKIAIVLITGEETPGIFTKASDHPALKTIKWIGTDGSACQNNIIADPISARFAEDVEFLASVYEVGMTLNGSYLPETSEIIKNITASTGLIPNSNTLNVYDAVKIYALACSSAGNREATHIKEALPVICNTYCTGELTLRQLNKSGDIANPVFGIWKVVDENGISTWKLFAHYNSKDNKIIQVNP